VPRTIVELNPDHPGFRDAGYRQRRNSIAEIAQAYQPGEPIPEAPYTEQEHGVWREVWRHLDPAHRRWACREYLRVSRELDLPRDRIPQLREVSDRIERMTGFRLEPVAGLVAPRIFLSALGDGIFLATQYIRHHSAPLYTPEPDVVHELTGHAALLASSSLQELNRLVGAAARRAPDDESLERLGRVYWYTIEFGVVREDGELRAYGAGLLSSAGELEAMHQAEIRPFDTAEMAATPYDVTRYQPVLFCPDSFDELVAKLREYLLGWRG